MRRLAFITVALLFSSNIFAQKIARSSIGCFGSSIGGSFSVVSGSPVSSPILQNRNTSTGISLQTRPFIQLRSNNTSTPIDGAVNPNPSSDMVCRIRNLSVCITNYKACEKLKINILQVLF